MPDLTLRLAATVLAIGSLATAASAATVIDDFETGTFHLVGTAGGFVSSPSSVSSPSHALASTRQVGLQSFVAGGLPATANLTAWTTGEDELHIAFPPGGGSIYLTYQPASPVDLTAGGINDRIVVDFSASTTGGSVVLMVLDTNGGHAAHAMPTSGGAHSFSFLDLIGADPTQVTTVQVEIHQSAWSQYRLRDIRAMRPAASWLRFEIPVETVVGPPYPLLPHAFTVTNATPSDLQRIQLLGATRIATGGLSGLALTGMDSGGDAEAGLIGTVRAAWNEPGQPYAGTAFDLRVDLSALSGIEPQPFLPALPAITPTPTGFLLEYLVEFLGPGGAPVRTSRRRMPFDVYPGQGIQLANVRVHPADTGEAGGPLAAGEVAGFRVTFDAEATGDVDTGEPLFEATFTGDSHHPGTVDVPPSGPPNGEPRLAARPSVTRGATELRLAQPAEAGATIAIHDVTGRLVRSLRVAAGGTRCTWDGCESTGRPAPAGVYLARFSDRGGTARTRIVVVR